MAARMLRIDRAPNWGQRMPLGSYTRSRRPGLLAVTDPTSPDAPAPDTSGPSAGAVAGVSIAVLAVGAIVTFGVPFALGYFIAKSNYK